MGFKALVTTHDGNCFEKQLTNLQKKPHKESNTRTDQHTTNAHTVETCVSAKYRSDTTLTRHLRRLVAAG